MTDAMKPPLARIRRGMAFGVFDGLHPGHEHFLRAAAARAEELIVVVAPDAAAYALKGRAPRHPLSERLNAVAALDQRFVVVPGDEESGSWRVIAAYAPDVVFLGHDQQAIAGALEERVAFEFISAHEPKTYKSSILNGKAPH